MWKERLEEIMQEEKKYGEEMSVFVKEAEGKSNGKNNIFSWGRAASAGMFMI